MAVRDVIDLLACPQCRQPLALTDDGRSVRCASGHVFDLARQGYLNLSRRAAPRNADTTTMVAARDRFLTAGHYRPLADGLSELAERDGGSPASRLLDVGTGTGYYLARLLDARPAARGIGLDVSVAAARRAARAHARIGSVVADAWGVLPVADDAIDLVLNVFAPRHGAEFARVLAPAGLVITATPEQDHLAELRSGLGLLHIASSKQEQLQAAWGGALVQESSETLRYGCDLDRAAAQDLIQMGPNAFHLEAPRIAELVASAPEVLPVTVAVTLTRWRSTA